MFDRRDDPAYLRSCLETMVDKWCGHRLPWFGIDADKLAETRLPEPLHWLYSYAGEWPSANWWESLFANQDILLPFESLQMEDGKLVFVWECQGVWWVGTLPEGDDPPVWVRDEDHPWQKLCDSLTEFLVTFCLHEIVFGLPHRTTSENILDRFDREDCHISPLWLNGPYVGDCRGEVCDPTSFHIVDAQFLVMDNYWCATMAEEPWERFPDLFKVPDESPRKLDGNLPFPDDVPVPTT